MKEFTDDVEIVEDVTLDGAAVRGPRREVGIVFQEPRLMPWLKVAENVQFGLDGVARMEALSTPD